MKKILYFAAAALLCASCFNVNVNFKDFQKGTIKGVGPVETRTMDLRDFNGICVKGGADVKFSQADSFSVSVTTQENVFDSLDFVVEDGILLIQTVSGKGVSAEKYEISISLPELSSIEINGAIEFKALTPWTVSGDLDIVINGAGDLSFKQLTCEKLSLKVNGASDVDASGLDVAAVDVKINGAGDVELSGKAGEADFEVMGAGDIDARELAVAGEVRKKTAGAARIRL